MSRQRLVSRADLLRLLAACPDAHLELAAAMTGHQPENQLRTTDGSDASEAESYETEPAEAGAQSQHRRSERFWCLHRRERLHPLSARLPRPTSLLADGNLALHPAELRSVRPLPASDLHAFAPEAADDASAVLPTRRPPAATLAKLVDEAACLRPARSRAAARKDRCRIETGSRRPAAAALDLLRSGQLHSDWLAQFILRLVRTWLDRKDDANLIRHARQALDLLSDQACRDQEHPSLLYGMACRDELRRGAVLPARYRPETVVRIIQEPLPPSEHLLVQEGEDIFLVNGPENGICLLKGSRIASLELSDDVLLLHRGMQTETVPVQAERPICRLGRGGNGFSLRTRSEVLHVGACTRPAWAHLIGRNSRDLFAEAFWLGKSYRLYWQVPDVEGEGQWKACHGPVGADRFGFHACIGFHGQVMQRFRWIGPGSFLMGSPVDEPEREVWGKETQHEATLTKGFWLAATAVTQELWQFVMRGNPSKFKGSGRPVENVSWHDVQLFIRRLNAMVPGLEARLPTEAEREYACRAGTSTPFAFGDRITPEQVNYNGSYPYCGGLKGAFRGRTVAVESLPCNAWGLHEMHGNVWEWCQDCWQDDLRAEPVVDPQGPENGDFRVVRGGSWSLGGKGVRSAVRGRFVPELRNDRVGFRLARDHEVGPKEIESVSAELPAKRISFLRRMIGKG